MRLSNSISSCYHNLKSIKVKKLGFLSKSLVNFPTISEGAYKFYYQGKGSPVNCLQENFLEISIRSKSLKDMNIYINSVFINSAFKSMFSEN